jgi:hypothetical protein
MISFSIIVSNFVVYICRKYIFPAVAKPRKVRRGSCEGFAGLRKSGRSLRRSFAVLRKRQQDPAKVSHFCESSGEGSARVSQDCDTRFVMPVSVPAVCIRRGHETGTKTEKNCTQIEPCGNLRAEKKYRE